MEVAAPARQTKATKPGRGRAQPSPASRENIRVRFSQTMLGLTGDKALLVSSPLRTHTAVREQEFSYSALLSLISNLQKTREQDVAQVVGLSDRTLRRHRSKPDTPMPTAVASKTLLVTDILAKAIEVFGTQAAAEDWLNQPALALNDVRPLELLQTEQGAELVKDQLTRLEYGVYS
jgi:putative toxin-antitoxin system antitoxin component (TIGR02293 family)